MYTVCMKDTDFLGVKEYDIYLQQPDSGKYLGIIMKVLRTEIT